MIHTLPGEDVFCLLVQLVADRVLIGSGGSNQEDIAAALSHHRSLVLERHTAFRVGCAHAPRLSTRPETFSPCFVPTSADSTW
jgi:hypothetical protein